MNGTAPHRGGRPGRPPGGIPEAFATADRLIRAIEDNDVNALRQIYAPGIDMRRNTEPAPVTGEAAVQATAGPRAAVASIRFEVVDRQLTERGFVQQEIAHIEIQPGQVIPVAIAVIADVTDGRIMRLHEYMDSSALRPQA